MVCCLCALESLAPVAQWDYEASALFSKLDAAAVCDDDRLTFSLFANAPPLRSRQTSDVRVALGHVQLTAGKNESRGIYYIGGETVGDTQTKGASRGLSCSRGASGEATLPLIEE
jgi:hypothetical protein